MKEKEPMGFFVFDLADCYDNGEYRKVAIRAEDISAVADVGSALGQVGCKVYLRGGKNIVLAETAANVLDILLEPIIADAFIAEDEAK